MASYSTNEFRNGLRLIIEGEPCLILDNELVKPGKGQAFNRVKLRNLKTGRVWERTFKSGESVAAADVQDLEMDYLYNDGQLWHFMATSDYEQHQAGEAAVGDAARWLVEGCRCQVTLWNGTPLSVTPPNFVELKVVEVEPGLKGDTATGGTKPATLSTGAQVRVPLFVNLGESLRIDTRTGEYVSRVKD